MSSEVVVEEKSEESPSIFTSRALRMTLSSGAKW
jgi:hypothetical protein